MNVRDFADLLRPIPRRRDQLLPALHAVHDHLGWLPEAAIEAAGRHVFVPLSEVYGIVTSYSELRLATPIAERIEVCTGLSCRLSAADAVVAQLEGAGHHVERLPCRFLCAVAPVIEFGGPPESAAPSYRGRFDERSAASLAPDGAASTATGAGDDRPAAPLTLRREQAIAAAARLAKQPAITYGDGVCAQAVGSANLRGLDSGSIRHSVRAVGCDGRCSAQPAVTIRYPDGQQTDFDRVPPAAIAPILASVPSGRQTPHREALAGAEHSAHPLYAGQVRRVLRNCGVIDPASFDDALAAGAYAGLERALALKPEDVIALVRDAGLRGRGGAYFPTHIKWSSACANAGPRYLVVNAEEGEPGVFKDRHLMEGDPHALVEGTLIAAYACGVERAFIYINGQARLSAARVEQALRDAATAGLLGEQILGSDFSCTIEIYRGAGGYVCGEESVILNSIEGERAVPRFRPPLPTEAGLWGRPTVLNNVETLVNLPLILTEGADWFRATGSEQFPGTKLMSLSGAVQRPGLYEVPMGMTIGAIIETCGGGALDGHTITAAVAGGPSGGLIPPSLFDLPIQGGMLHESGPVLGAGGIVLLDERTPVSFALRELTAYNKEESCGKCTPCREGTERALAILDRAGAESLSPADREQLLLLSDLMQTASLCALGQMAPGPIRSALALFDQVGDGPHR